MFFGYKPAENKLVGLKIKSEKFRKCTPGKKCIGSWFVSGVCKCCGSETNHEVFHYKDGDPDQGVIVFKKSVVIDGNTFMWIEENE